VSAGALELARAEVRYCHDRVALLRAKHYRWGLGTTPRLQELERELQRAERRLSELLRARRAEAAHHDF
jgi:hypothetical protein